MGVHASVNYVEPNFASAGMYVDGGSSGALTWKVEDGFDRSPRLEDYCITLNLEVEVCSRENISAARTVSTDVLIMSYKTTQGGSGSTVNFMGGTKMKSDGDKGVATPFLTTNYADMYVGDLIDYGTTEMIGIKSVDIEYRQNCVPVINIKFTDVRGLSLFQPTELSRTNSYQGIVGINSDNVAQSFFQCFFRVPMPRFTITIKGFYGKPVTYEVLCDKFETNFNSSTGDFDVDTRFIGYSYSFLTDISIDALLAAPYSDYCGDEDGLNKYWKSKVADESEDGFWVLDKNGSKMAMPTLIEVWEHMYYANDENPKAYSVLTCEESRHDDELQELGSLEMLYTQWYETLFGVCVSRYGEDRCFMFGGRDVGGSDNGSSHRRIIILAADGSAPTLADEFKSYPSGFKSVHSALISAVEDYNKSDKPSRFRKLPSPSAGFDEYFLKAVFNDVFVDGNDTLRFGGFDPMNPLPQTEVINKLFHEVGDLPEDADEAAVKGAAQERKRHMLNVIWNKGVNQLTHAYVIELDYSSITDRVKWLQADRNRPEEEKREEKRRKEYNDRMIADMKWYPTVENFTRIMMAHLETFMYQLYNVVSKCSGRKASELGVTTGPNGIASDVNSSKGTIPPFPRVTRNIVGEDGITRVEDEWVGVYHNDKAFEEVDFINGLFNGIERIRNIMKQHDAITGVNSASVDDEQPSAAVSHPMCPFDFFMTGRPYGAPETIWGDITLHEFAGRVCVRMFHILSLSSLSRKSGFFDSGSYGDIGALEAQNFIGSVRGNGRNRSFLDQFTNMPSEDLAERVLGIVTNTKPEPGHWKTPSGSLFSNNGGMMLDYVASVDNLLYEVYPMQNIDFGTVNTVLKSFADGRGMLGNGDVSLSALQGNISLNNLASTGWNNIVITDEFGHIDSVVGNANNGTGDSSSPNTGFFSKLSEAVLFDGKDKIYQTYLAAGSGSLYCIDEGEPRPYQLKGDGERLLSEAQTGAISGFAILTIPSLSFRDGRPVSITPEHVRYDTSTPMMSSVQGYAGPTPYRVPEVATPVGRGERDIVRYLFSIPTANLKGLGDNPFMYIPNLFALKIGFMCFDGCDAKMNFTKDKLRKKDKKIVITKQETDYIGNLSKPARCAFAKYWLDNRFKVVADTNSVLGECWSDDGTRLNHSNKFVIEWSNMLLKPVLIAQITKNARVSTYRMSLDIGAAKAYLTGFIDEIKKAYRIDYTVDDEGNFVQTADLPKKTSDDMKMELYRYCKQVYDKWVPMSSFDDWKMRSFFVESKKGEGVGHTFYFIDSFYNYIGDKLLINPNKLSERIHAIMSNPDVNAMLLGFMGDIFADNKCMMLSIQNFADLNKPGAMDEMFVPMSFNSIPWDDLNKHPSFVVVYPYEASKNLNIPNNEYNNDGFMLNDEHDTPKPILSKIPGTKGHYYLPAFGVAYGRQYQSYFKSVNVNMTNPVATQQSIKAKHFILQANQNPNSKSIVGQDLYDVYATQSYTCNVEMMGCAWVQPLMYFVLLNVPMFRGSYMIMSVKHSIRPGDMTTTFTGCRMANVTNRLVENLFSDDEIPASDSAYSEYEEMRSRKASIDNDCPYKIFPLYSSDSTELSGDELADGLKIMGVLMDAGFNKAPAAGIVGNMYVESHDCKGTGKKFVYDLVKEDAGSTSGGLCMWHDGNLIDLVNNKTQGLGHNKEELKPFTEQVRRNYSDKLRQLNSGDPIAGQCMFVWNMMQEGKGNYIPNGCSFSKYNAIASPTEAAKSFMNNWERPSEEAKRKSVATRTEKAEMFYAAYNGSVSSTKQTSAPSKDSKRDIHEALFEAVSRSCAETPSIGIEIQLNSSKRGTYKYITQKNGKSDKMHIVFDMMLNSPYYDNIQTLYWAYEEGGLQGDVPPSSIIFVASDSIVSTSKKVYFVKVKSELSDVNSTAVDVRNKHIARSLAKRRKTVGNDKNFLKEVPQLKTLEMVSKLDGFMPEDCDSVLSSGEGKIHTVTTPCTPVSGSAGKITYNGVTWDVGKSVTFINSHTVGANGKHSCARAVEDAIRAGGGPSMACGKDCEMAATNLHYKGILSRSGFVLIYRGSGPPQWSVNPNILQAGDICVIGDDKCRVPGTRFHACMWTGSQWVSDYKQVHMIPNYKSRPEWPYFIYRFGNERLKTS